MLIIGELCRGPSVAFRIAQRFFVRCIKRINTQERYGGGGGGFILQNMSERQEILQEFRVTFLCIVRRSD